MSDGSSIPESAHLILPSNAKILLDIWQRSQFMAWLPFRGCCSDASSPTYQLAGPSEQWVSSHPILSLKTKPPSKGLGLPLAPLDFQTFLRPWIGMVWRVAGSRLSADQSYTTCSTQVKGFATFEEHFCRGHEQRDACCQASLVFRMTLPGLLEAAAL